MKLTKEETTKLIEEVKSRLLNSGWTVLGINDLKNHIQALQEENERLQARVIKLENQKNLWLMG